MSRFTQRKIRTLTGLLCAMTFSMFVFSYTLREPSLYFFRSVLGLSGRTCSCQHCITHLDDENDSWFMERFNQSFHPLMSRKSSTLPDETYRWWQGLQAEESPSNLTIVLDRLFQLIPAEERYVDAHPDRCRSCSVVGNSGNLRETGYGSFIDSSDFVIRMNQAPTQGFEEDVGYKTTHHLMYPESATDLDNSTSLILIPFKTLDLEWIISALTTGDISKQIGEGSSYLHPCSLVPELFGCSFLSDYHSSFEEVEGGTAVSIECFSQLLPRNIAVLRGSLPLWRYLEQLVRSSPSGPPLQGTELAAPDAPEASLARLVHLGGDFSFESPDAVAQDLGGQTPLGRAV
ncbi:CMP-N-acetylneuraminate-beta-galactosamide-alpha-2,3-sialyltransferase 1-like [Carassius gibelio]|uniref:CMP-N-acetylneuraminate-beta-galactosamide- alpha-2,3-sialyltransferase 1-like n=1 Tax=Carassius gibelio TaxID=101364 RepID=UPI002278BD86|nr:CMP-N-acetylneuraminate-beta-galactosamide-alpha-2,3-sialyltransferase 1-like [Carassius gibelio]